MEPYKPNHLDAALFMGEAIIRSNDISLTKVEEQKLTKCIQQGVTNNPSGFQKDYANAILKGLAEKRLAQN